MPDEQYWESLFDIPLVLDRLEIGSCLRRAAELGCASPTHIAATPTVARNAGMMVMGISCDQSLDRKASPMPSTMRFNRRALDDGPVKFTILRSPRTARTATPASAV